MLPHKLKQVCSETFLNCSQLESVVIPDGLFVIGASAFENCSNLKNINFPDSIYTIEQRAFSNCMLFESLNLPKNLTEIGDYAFNYCINLKNVVFNDNIESVGRGAFLRCKNLKKVTMSDSVKSLAESVFEDCENLEQITLSELITEISDCLFINCSSLKNIKLPSNLTKIGRGSFANCESLEAIEIPETVTEIGYHAFANCSSLKKMILPEKLKALGENVFEYCDSLEEIFVPRGLNKFGEFSNNNLKFFSKEENGFSLTNQRKENSIPIESLKIDMSFLSNHWNRRDLIYNEQKNAKVADFYNLYLINRPESEINAFFDSHNFTFLKKFDIDFNEPKHKRVDFYKTLYILGAFNKSVEVNGKMIDYSQKVSEFLIRKFTEKETTKDEISLAFINIEEKSFNREFTEFFLLNFDEIIKEERNNQGFIARCYTEFERVQKTNTSNRGSQRQLKPTVEKFLSYFDKNKFVGVTDETQEISDTISPYFSSQETFEKATSIDQERINNNTPNNILSFHLTEKNVFSVIDGYAEEIRKNQVEILENCVNIAENQFTYDWLEKNDPQNFILGKLCSCCSHLEGAGVGIMKASIIHPDVQTMVIRDKKGEIIAKSTLYINRKQGYGVFNNIEVSDDIPAEKKELIYQKYLKGIEEFAKHYNMENPNRPLLQINVGMGHNDLEDEIQNNHTKAINKLKAIDYREFTENEMGYNGDSSTSQYVLWVKDEQENEKQ